MNLFARNLELTFACTDQPTNVVAEQLLSVLNQRNPNPGLFDEGPPYAAHEVNLDFRLINNGVAAPNPTPRHILLWTPRSNPTATAIMDNVGDGMEVLLHRIANKMGGHIASVSIFDRQPSDFPGSLFSFYDCTHGARRYIAAILDVDGWKFVNDGVPLSFERPGLYRKPRIADRLNRHVISEYLAALGYDVSRDGFWETDSRAIILCQSGLWKNEAVWVHYGVCTEPVEDAVAKDREERLDQLCQGLP